MADVNGTINVEVLYREAGSPGSGGGAPGNGGGTASGSEAAEEKKKKQEMSQQTKFLKGIFGSLTIGALIKQSKIGSTFLGTLTQLMGALVDVFLMPFIPLLIPVLKFLAKVVTWFAKFMQDPGMMLKEAFLAAWNFVKDAIVAMFTFGPHDLKNAFGDIPWGTILNPKNWFDAGIWAIDKVLPILVGAGGLWTMAKIMSYLFGASGSLIGSLKTALGLGGNTVTDMLSSSKCCPGAGVANALPGGGPGRARTAVSAAGSFAAGAAGTIATGVKAVLTSGAAGPIFIAAAAGAAAVTTTVLGAKAIQNLDQNRDVTAPEAKAHFMDAILDKNIMTQLKAYEEQLGQRRYLETSKGSDKLVLEDELRGIERQRDFTAALQRFTQEGESSELFQMMRSGAFDQGFTEKDGFVQDAMSGQQLIVELGMTDQWMEQMLQVVDFKIEYNNRGAQNKSYQYDLSEDFS